MTKKRIAPKRVRIETFKNLTEDQLKACNDQELKDWLAGIEKLSKTDSKVDACKIFIEHQLKTRESEKWNEDLKKKNAEARDEVPRDENGDVDLAALNADVLGTSKEVLAKKSQKKKEPKPKKQSKADTPKKEKGPKVTHEIVECLKKAGRKGITKESILEKLIEIFPDRDPEKMKATVTVQVPGRISKEKFLVEKLGGKKYRVFKSKK